MTLATARLLVGRTIVGFECEPWRDANGPHYSPCIILDNGARVMFSVTETDSGDCYGISPNYYPRGKQPKARTP